jgi:hypothetical protein
MQERGAKSERERILAEAALLHRAHQRVDEAFHRRDESAQARADWSAACHAARRAMYDGDLTVLPDRVWGGDQAAVESAVVFLEADPWCFHSGYLKARLLRALRRATLTDDQVGRLAQALLHAVDVSDRREFAQWYRLASQRLDRELVVTELQRRAHEHADQDVRRGARWLLTQLVVQ